MEAMTLSEMGDMCGRAGITFGVCGRFTTQAAFQSINIGDSDGWGNTGGVDAYAGWLVLVGTGTNTGYIRIVIEDGAQMTFDAGRTDATFCPITGTANPNAAVPANKSFFVFGLTDTIINLEDPTTINLYLSNAAHTYPANDRIGFLWDEGVAIEKDPNMDSTLYIWYH